MATTVARLQAVITADTRDFNRGMDQSESKMGKVQKAAGLAGLAIAGGLAVGAKHAIDAASNLNEQISKTDVIFGKNAKEVHEWSKDLSGSFGLSQRAALEAAGTYGNMLKPMGIATPLVKKMSTSMVELAGDMASFNNASPEETLDALRAGLAGETEPLRRFGVFLNEDRIALEAVSSGLVKAKVDMAAVKLAQIDLNEKYRDAAEALREHGKGSEEYAAAQAHVDYQESKVAKLLAGKVPKLTAAQKAQASYNLITKDTVDTQGDFARTSDSVANQQRIMRAEIENLSAQLGQALLPVVKDVLGVFSDLLGFLTEHKTITKALILTVAGLATGMLAFSVATKVAAAAQTLLNLAMRANPIGIIITLLFALGVAIVAAWKKSATFRAIVTGTWNAIKAAASATADVFRNKVWPFITDAIDLIQKHPAWLLIKAQIGLIVDVVKLMIGAFKWLRDNGGEAINKLWGKVKEPIGTLVDSFGDLWNLIKSIVGGFKWMLDKGKDIGGFFSDVGNKLDPRNWGDPFDPSFLGVGIVPTAGNVQGVNLMGANPEMLPFAQLGYSLGLHTTSGFRAGAITASGRRSDHSIGKALDMADGPSNMAAFFRALIGNPRVKQAFYDPLGSIFGGQWNSYREGGHSDHVHVATYDRGGWLRPGWNLAYNGTGRPEAVGAGMPDRLYLDLGDLGVVELVRKGKQRFEKLNGPGSW